VGFEPMVRSSPQRLSQDEMGRPPGLAMRGHTGIGVLVQHHHGYSHADDGRGS
jgi:hypothetical protein